MISNVASFVTKLFPETEQGSLYISNILEFNSYTNYFQLSTMDGVHPLLEGIGWVELLRLAPESLNPSWYCFCKMRSNRVEAQEV